MKHLKLYGRVRYAVKIQGMSRRERERNEVLDTFVYAMAGLQGLISMGLRLNDEAEVIAAAKIKGDGAIQPTNPTPPVIRSSWMG